MNDEKKPLKDLDPKNYPALPPAEVRDPQRYFEILKKQEEEKKGS